MGSRLRLPSNEPPVESERNPKVQNGIFGECASRLGLVAKSAFRGVRTVPERNPKVAISFGFRQKIWCRPSWRTREHFPALGLVVRRSSGDLAAWWLCQKAQNGQNFRHADGQFLVNPQACTCQARPMPGGQNYSSASAYFYTAPPRKGSL